MEKEVLNSFFNPIEAGLGAKRLLVGFSSTSFYVFAL